MEDTSLLARAALEAPLVRRDELSLTKNARPLLPLLPLLGYVRLGDWWEGAMMQVTLVIFWGAGRRWSTVRISVAPPVAPPASPPCGQPHLSLGSPTLPEIYPPRSGMHTVYNS